MLLVLFLLVKKIIEVVIQIMIFILNKIFHNKKAKKTEILQLIIWI